MQAAENKPVREFRSLKVGEMRADQEGDKQYLSGYAATYNTLSGDLGWGMRELILPGAFARAVKEKQDVRHLINHDANLVLGRTASGTTELSEDAKGLKFRTLLPDTSYARDLFASVSRGDVDECSFGFMAIRTSWIEEPDPENPDYPRDVRQLEDVDLFDVSTVTYPAYPNTKTSAERSLFPDGVPVEIRSRQEQRDAKDGDPCACACTECVGGDCEDCTNLDCDDENCRCATSRAARMKRDNPKPTQKSKRVDGEDLTRDAFLLVGDPLETKSWKLPVKFTDAAKVSTQLRNNLCRFNSLTGFTPEATAAAWTALVAKCKEHGVGVSDEAIRSRLTPEQIYDFEKDEIDERTRRRLREIEIEMSL